MTINSIYSQFSNYDDNRSERIIIMQFVTEGPRTYPIPNYTKKLFRKCPECARLLNIRDNFLGSDALIKFGHSNEITCVLCNKKYHWEIVYKAGKGLNDYFDTWGWVARRQ